MFGYTNEMIKRQLNVRNIVPDVKAGPIDRTEGISLEPCIRGAKKINNNPQMKQMVKETLMS